MFVSLRKNDVVYIKHGNEGDFLMASATEGLPSFGGVLLFAE